MSNENNVKAEGRDVKVEDKKKSFIEEQKEKVAYGLVQSATTEISESWFNKYSCGCETLKKYFDIDTADFFKRFFHALIPFNPYFYDSIEYNPDLWGPFWIYTFLIFIIAACGSIQKYLNNTEDSSSFFQEFIPISAGLIYGVGFLVPLVLYAIMKCFGSNTNYVQILCAYGYSYSIFIPIVIACSLPIGVSEYIYFISYIVLLQWIQWILLGYSVFSSTALLLVALWKELNKYMDGKKYIILCVLIIAQVGLFLMLKLYFFSYFEKEVKGDESSS